MQKPTHPDKDTYLLQVFAHLPTPMLIVDNNLTCMLVNSAWQQQVCTTAEPGINARHCFPGGLHHDLDKLTPATAQQATTLQLGNWLFTCQTLSIPSVHPAWMITAAPQQGPSTAESLLEDKLEQLQHVLDNMEEGVCVTDVQGNIAFTNEALNRMFGYGASELQGKDASILNAYTREENEQKIADIRQQVYRGERWSGNWFNRKKDGTTFYTQARITSHGNGDHMRFICVQRDITREQDTLEALQQETKLKQTITDNATATLFMMNAQGYCTFMNPAGEAMFGYTQEEIRAKPLHYLIHHHRPDGSFYPMHECPIDRALPENFDVRAHEDLFFRKDGSSLLVSCAASPIFENGVPVSTVIEVRDITRQKEAEQNLKRSAEELEQKVKERTAELETANERLKQFAYAASHDLQEPLRKIHFYADRIKENTGHQLSDADKGMFERMELATQRMRILIDDLLNYAHTSMGTGNFVTVDLNKLLREVKEDMEASIIEKDAWIQSDSLPTIKGDARQLRQLFQNLLSNALKYTQPGLRPQVNISCQLLEQPGTPPMYRITISDNGIGFEQADADRIFNVFQRLHGRSEYSGTGVGLAIVRKVAENHDGTVTAESEPGKGARFYVSLPAL